ncbi:MAG: aldo/keto reductase [Alphaproteobacteria bacterium]
MATIELWNGQTIPRIGMGCWAIGGTMRSGTRQTGWGKVDDKVSIAAIHRAIELGVRYFDTADTYGGGHSEQVLSRALRDRGDDIVVSTKFGNTFDAATRTSLGPSDDPAYVRAAIEASLRRLGRERLDLVFFHLNGHPIDRSEPVFEALADLRRAGKIDEFGWSTDDVAGAAAFADMEGFVAVQHDMNMFQPAADMVQLINEKRLIGVARQPLAMGLLTGKFRKGERPFARSDIRADGPAWLSYFRGGVPDPQMLARLEAVRDLLTCDGRTVAQGALGWIWARAPRVVPIPGFRTVRQVNDNAGALEKGPLPAAIMAEIDVLFAPVCVS